MFASLTLSVLFAVCDLAEIFADRTAWEMNAVDFTVDHAGDGFAFADDSREVVNCLRRGAVVWKGFEVWESRIYFGADGVKRVEMSLYNRGDDTNDDGLDDKALKKLLGGVEKAVDALTGGRNALGRPQQSELKSGGSQFIRRTAKTDPAVELAWGVGEGTAKMRKASFVRVTVMPRELAKPGKVAKKPVSGQAAAKKTKANVTKNDEGDVWIRNVPMVDQGQKGYCSVATSERVLRYYGFDIDEHQLAQMAGSTARGGTSTDEMIETVKTVGSKCRLGFEQIVGMASSVKDIGDEIEAYNKAAKSEKERELSLAEFTRGNMIMVGELREAMKPKVLKKMRTKDSRYKKFLAGIKTQIDRGIPVFWGVTLGIFPEPGLPQTIGGHQRLIIGYNQKKHEILYTDSWGAGHELKRMPEDWAFTITNDAFFLRPL